MGSSMCECLDGIYCKKAELPPSATEDSLHTWLALASETIFLVGIINIANVEQSKERLFDGELRDIHISC